MLREPSQLLLIRHFIGVPRGIRPPNLLIRSRSTTENWEVLGGCPSVNGVRIVRRIAPFAGA